MDLLPAIGKGLATAARWAWKNLLEGLGSLLFLAVVAALFLVPLALQGWMERDGVLPLGWVAFGVAVATLLVVGVAAVRARMRGADSVATMRAARNALGAWGGVLGFLLLLLMPGALILGAITWGVLTSPITLFVWAKDRARRRAERLRVRGAGETAAGGGMRPRGGASKW